MNKEQKAFRRMTTAEQERAIQNRIEALKQIPGNGKEITLTRAEFLVRVMSLFDEEAFVNDKVIQTARQMLRLNLFAKFMARIAQLEAYILFDGDSEQDADETRE